MRMRRAGAGGRAGGQGGKGPPEQASSPASPSLSSCTHSRRRPKGTLSASLHTHTYIHPTLQNGKPHKGVLLLRSSAPSCRPAGGVLREIINMMLTYPACPRRSPVRTRRSVGLHPPHVVHRDDHCGHPCSKLRECSPCGLDDGLSRISPGRPKRQAGRWGERREGRTEAHEGNACLHSALTRS